MALLGVAKFTLFKFQFLSQKAFGQVSSGTTGGLQNLHFSVSIIESFLPSVSPRSVIFVFSILGMSPFKYLAWRTQYIPPTLTKLTFFMIDSFIIFSALLNFKLPRKSSEVFWTPQFFWRYFATLKTAGRSKKSAATESGATFRGGEELVPK